MSSTTRRYIGVPEVAERYGYTAWHVYELARTCQLPHRKHPGKKCLFFDPVELDLFDDGARLETRRLAKGGRVVRPVK